MGEVPALLDGALTHVRDRLDAEAVLLDAVAERRFEIADQVRLDAANKLIQILRECRHRHDELHAHLISARTRLREVLDDRFARAPTSAHRTDLATDLFRPYLARTTGEGAALADRMLALLGGLPTRWLPSLAALTDGLCAPSREPEPGEEFIAPQFTDTDEPEWWEPYEDTAQALFEAIEEPVQLSQLIARADQLAVEAGDGNSGQLNADLLAASMVHAAHRAWATRLAGRLTGDRVVIAVATGDHIDTELLYSANLLLVPGIVTADIVETSAHREKAPLFGDEVSDVYEEEPAT